MPWQSVQQVDDRWQSAVNRVRRRLPPDPRPEDEWATKSERFIAAVVACRDEAERETVAHQFPDLDAAFQLRTGPDKLARALVEARLLARMPVPEVAAASGLTPQAVEVYERLFFATTEQIDNTRYILHYAVGPKHRDRSSRTEEDLDTLLRWAGYIFGPLLVEELARYFALGAKMPERLDGLTPMQWDELYRSFLMHSLVRTWLLPEDETDQALQFEQLRRELQVALDSLPGPGVVAALRPTVPDDAGCQPAPRPFLEPTPALRVALKAWEDTWQRTILIASLAPPFGTPGSRCKRRGVNHGVGSPR
jgi:hypothetical protein